MKILLVEDDANLREVTQRSLEKERYVVEIAADYRTALQKIEDYDYDCILLDIMLPDGNALVRQTFKVSNVGTIAGGYVKDGKVERNA